MSFLIKITILSIIGDYETAFYILYHSLTKESLWITKWMFFIHLFNTIMNVKVSFYWQLCWQLHCWQALWTQVQQVLIRLTKALVCVSDWLKYVQWWTRELYRSKGSIEKDDEWELKQSIARDMYAECETAIEQQQEAINSSCTRRARASLSGN